MTDGIFTEWIPLDAKTILEWHGASYFADIVENWHCFVAFEWQGCKYLESVYVNDTEHLYLKLHKLLQRLSWRDDASFEAWQAAVVGQAGISDVLVNEVVQVPIAPNYYAVSWRFFGIDCFAVYYPEAMIEWGEHETGS